MNSDIQSSLLSWLMRHYVLIGDYILASTYRTRYYNFYYGSQYMQEIFNSYLLILESLIVVHVVWILTLFFMLYTFFISLLHTFPVNMHLIFFIIKSCANWQAKSNDHLQLKGLLFGYVHSTSVFLVTCREKRKASYFYSVDSLIFVSCLCRIVKLIIHT